MTDSDVRQIAQNGTAQGRQLAETILLLRAEQDRFLSQYKATRTEGAIAEIAAGTTGTTLDTDAAMAIHSARQQRIAEHYAVKSPVKQVPELAQPEMPPARHSPGTLRRPSRVSQMFPDVAGHPMAQLPAAPAQQPLLSAGAVPALEPAIHQAPPQYAPPVEQSHPADQDYQETTRQSVQRPPSLGEFALLFVLSLTFTSLLIYLFLGPFQALKSLVTGGQPSAPVVEVSPEPIPEQDPSSSSGEGEAIQVLPLPALE